MKLFVFPIDFCGLRFREDINILAVFEEGFVPKHVKTCFSQVIDIAYIPGHVKGDAASAIRDEFVSIDDGYF
jgi:hypothetical protein